MNKFINKLISYGLEKGLFNPLDKDFVVNQLMEYFNLDDISIEELSNVTLDDLLEDMLCYYNDNNLLEQNINFDMFSTKVLSFVTDKPSVVINKFNELYKESPKKATDYFHDFSVNTNYIKMKEVAKNVKFKANSDYGVLDITINLSKPEKDPKEIARMKDLKSATYPKCLLCKENVGVYGKLNYPARSTHRIVPLTINNTKFHLQYSPYEYFNEHSIVLSDAHTPMTINKETFKSLLDFVELFPHYFIGSNSDIPIVGGSILSHEHYQAGNYKFTMDDAKEIYNTKYKDINISILKWPLSVIRLKGNNKESLVELSNKYLNDFINYSNEYIVNKTDARHNAITPIVRYNNGFEVDLVLRNNLTTKERPDGLYHPRKEYHHIKKENIGLIEVMGLAVLPARLQTELNEIKDVITKKTKLNDNLKHHEDWVKYLINKYQQEDITEFINKEVGIRFTQVLEDCGVFNNKLDDFISFVESVIK